MSSEFLIQQILRQAEEHLSTGKKCLAVFDLDSTLFDVSPRIQKVLRDFAQHPHVFAHYPDLQKVLSEIKTERSDWGIRQALERSGIAKHAPELHEEVRKFWVENFFSNDYIHFDTPYEGAVEFVQSMNQLQVEIVYLTGRDQHRMGLGSVEVLKKWNFPLHAKAQLVLKPEKGMDDAKFKSDWFAEVPPNAYDKIWFFENEPVNIYLVNEEHPQVDIVFFESTHSGKAASPKHLPTLTHFQRFSK